MSEYVLVKETMIVSRYHLVKDDGKKAIKLVEDCEREAEYLHSCDELDYDSDIEYEVIKLDEDWDNDLRLRCTARHIEERLSQEPQETDLTRRRRKGIIKSGSKKKAPKKGIDAIALLDKVTE